MSTPRLVARRYGRHGHGYTIDGTKVPSVTGITGVLPKQLTQWSSDCAANFAVEHWDELAEQSLTKRLDAIRFAHKDVVGEAAVRGQDVHRYGEPLVRGEAVEIPDELRGPAEAYARFLDAWAIEPVAIETPVASITHRYGGRADLWAKVGARDNALALIDLKTGKNVYESTVLQLAGYRYAEIWQPDGPDSEQPILDVDWVYVAHILPDDVRMLPVSVRESDFRQFLYAQQTYLWLERHGWKGDEPLIGDQVRPGDTEPVPA
jgi:hypothetical protein